MAGADLTDADLTGASFAGASLVRANLTNAKCVDSDFFQAQFWSVNLTGTDLTGSQFGYSIFQDTDMSEAKGLEQVRHDSPSTIGLDTLFRSNGQIPESFLTGAGVPPAANGFLATASADDTSLRQCFICLLYTSRVSTKMKSLPGRSATTFGRRACGAGCSPSLCGAMRWWTGIAPRTKKRSNVG